MHSVFSGCFPRLDAITMPCGLDVVALSAHTRARGRALAGRSCPRLGRSNRTACRLPKAAIPRRSPLRSAALPPWLPLLLLPAMPCHCCRRPVTTLLTRSLCHAALLATLRHWPP